MLDNCGKTGKMETDKKVQRWIRQAKKNYYAHEIQELKKKNPKQWWDYINKELG